MPASAATWGSPAPTNRNGRFCCAISWHATMTAASSEDERYWTSSMNSPTAVSRSLAASAIATRRRGRSCSRLPVSPSPGARSTLSSRSPTATLNALAKFTSTPAAPAQAPPRRLAKIEGRRPCAATRASAAPAANCLRAPRSAPCEIPCRRPGHGGDSAGPSCRLPRSPSRISPLAGRPARIRSMSMAASLEEAVPAGQLRRLQTGPGDERVASAIHDGILAKSYGVNKVSVNSVYSVNPAWPSSSRAVQAGRWNVSPVRSGGPLPPTSSSQKSRRSLSQVSGT